MGGEGTGEQNRGDAIRSFRNHLNKHKDKNETQDRALTEARHVAQRCPTTLPERGYYRKVLFLTTDRVIASPSSTRRLEFFSLLFSFSKFMNIFLKIVKIFLNYTYVYKNHAHFSILQT